MRILFVSTFFPPHVIGGWEQLVEDLVHGMRARGHDTCVLTTNYGSKNAGATQASQPDVKRILTLESDLQYYRPADFLTYKRRVQQNLNSTCATIESFRPDVVFVHIMWNLTRAVPWIAEQLLPGRVVYYVADHWPYAPDPHEVYWRDTGGSTRKALKKLVAPIALRMVDGDRRRFHLVFDHVLCVSHAIRDALVANTNIPPQNLTVVYNGIDLNDFRYHDNVRASGGQLKLLYAGSLFPHKGVHVAIEAMALLAHRNQVKGMHLTIVGSGRPDYEAQLRATVSAAGLEDYVEFAGRVPRTEIPEQLAQHDVLIFPSAWPEPLARITQEAMATGVVVIGTTTGGTGEILVVGETGLTFAPGDGEMLAQRIIELRADPALFMRLRQNARRCVEQKFDIQRMFDETEDLLSHICSQATTQLSERENGMG